MSDPMSSPARLEEIRARAVAGDYYCREHWGLFDADEDVLFLLALIDELRPQPPSIETGGTV